MPMVANVGRSCARENKDRNPSSSSSDRLLKVNLAAFQLDDEN